MHVGCFHLSDKGDVQEEGGAVNDDLSTSGLSRSPFSRGSSWDTRSKNACKHLAIPSWRLVRAAVRIMEHLRTWQALPAIFAFE